MTPEKLYKRYIDEFCHTCTKENECHISITRYNGITRAQCNGYKQSEYCMQRKCNGCKHEEKCFKNEKSNS